jgi:hypothetical protein
VSNQGASISAAGTPLVTFRLHRLGLGMRLGLSGLVMALLIGLAASASTLYGHYERRDELPGLTRDDVKAAYHGLDAPSPLLRSLQSGHPETLTKPDRDQLIAWLTGDKLSENYDNLDLGPSAPAEIIAKNCLNCHGKAAPATVDPKAKAVMLDTWDQVRKLAFSRKLERTPDKIKAISTHTHALSMATMSLAVLAMAWLSRWPRWLVGGVAMIHGLGLVADIAGWWLAGSTIFGVTLHFEWAVDLIIIGGAAYSSTFAALLGMVLLELWWPAFGRR